MTSKAKKNKAKNSYIFNGGDKCDKKIKRMMYFTKRRRNQLKEDLMKYGNQVVGD